MKHKIIDIAFPQKDELSKNQQSMMKEYLSLYKKWTKDKSLSANLLKYLTNMYRDFNDDLKKKYLRWYRYQVTFIDPTIPGSAHILDILNLSGIDKSNLVFEESGKGFFIIFDNKNAMSLFSAINQKSPGLKYQILDVN